MSCIELPAVALPTLPAGITLPGLTISLGGEIDFPLCCKLPPIPIPIPPLPIPPIVLNPALLAVLNGYIAVMQSYIHALPLKCPLE